jgi:DNA-binding winged helix-turn-helix (wHTH) protein
METKPTYRFDRFVLNLGRGCLQDGADDLELRPKSYEVLCQLVQNAGRLLSRDRLFETVWPDVIISDDAVAHCIRDIRKALDDRDARFIRTVPRDRRLETEGEEIEQDHVPDGREADEIAFLGLAVEVADMEQAR